MGNLDMLFLLQTRLSYVIRPANMKMFSLARATAKPLTKLATLLVLFSTVDCPWSAVLSEQLACPDSFFLRSASIFFLNNSMKLPSLANALAPAAFPSPCDGLAGDAGLLPLDSLLLPWGVALFLRLSSISAPICLVKFIFAKWTPRKARLC